MRQISDRSLWSDTLPASEAVRLEPRLRPGDTNDHADVLVVGAGFTGLWTAWYLLERQPDLRVVVVEQEHVGFGASGRNGGWCSALLPMSLPKVASRHGESAAIRMQRAMHDTVRAVEAFVDDHGAPGIVHRGGTVDLARSSPQADRFRHELDTYRRFGFGDDDYRWLGRTEALETCAASGVLGAFATPHCATVHPLRLVHALARAVVNAGGEIREGVRVAGIRAGAATTDHGRIDADVIVRATEGYTAELDGERRTILPIYSLMIATAPLADDVWAQIGLHDRPTFADGRHLIVYGQRTADGRLAFGGRGAPYHFGSAIRPEFDRDDRIRVRLTTSLTEMFPALGDVEVTHHWGGVLGAPRDWQCGVRFDRRTGLASAGGYVGDGVAASNLAGRTVAALVLDSRDDHDRELVRLPWVGHRSRSWEPEPLRWLGVNAGRLAASRADAAEARSGRESSVWSGLVDLLLRR